MRLVGEASPAHCVTMATRRSFIMRRKVTEGRLRAKQSRRVARQMCVSSSTLEFWIRKETCLCNPHVLIRVCVRTETALRLPSPACSLAPRTKQGSPGLLWVRVHLDEEAARPSRQSTEKYEGSFNNTQGNGEHSE